MKDSIIPPFYDDIRFHEYRYICFFTALWKDMIVVRPKHEEVLNALTDDDRFCKRLYDDSRHEWANLLSLEETRERIIEYTHDAIDYILKGQRMVELNNEYEKKKAIISKQQSTFWDLQDEVVKEKKMSVKV